MIILHGRHKGKKAKLVQFANDWISGDLEDNGMPIILNPVSVQLETPEEVDEIHNTRVGVGFFHKWYRLTDDWKFVKR